MDEALPRNTCKTLLSTVASRILSIPRSTNRIFHELIKQDLGVDMRGPQTERFPGGFFFKPPHMLGAICLKTIVSSTPKPPPDISRG